jgi:hypothetical protein
MKTPRTLNRERGHCRRTNRTKIAQTMRNSRTTRVASTAAAPDTARAKWCHFTKRMPDRTIMDAIIEERIEAASDAQ